ncbi:MAG: hypothetical protein J6N52_12735 [Clostridia bacterium]|nr:hypothetical protein [Clostridia bacterium]
MEQKELKILLEKTANGEISVDNAMLKFKAEPFEDSGFAKYDKSHRRFKLCGI